MTTYNLHDSRGRIVGGADTVSDALDLAAIAPSVVAVTVDGDPTGRPIARRTRPGGPITVSSDLAFRWAQ